MHEGDGPYEHLPSQAEAHDPDGERATGVCQAARGRADVPCHAQPEEVKQRDADGNHEAGVKHGGGVDELVPSPGKVEPRRSRGIGGDGDEGENRKEEEDGERAEETLVPNGQERWDGIPGENLLFDDELSRSAIFMGGAIKTR